VAMPQYFEAVGNLHVHTPYSDGTLYHRDVADAALRAGLDFLVFTDHNVLVKGVEGWHERDGKRVLILTGEEIHDQTRQPQKNHLLVYGAERELASLAADPQALIDGANQAGGMAFLAHPFDPPVPFTGDSDLSWVSWEVEGYQGIELWNFMTSFKALLTSRLAAIRHAYNPDLAMDGPPPQTLQKWDELLAAGKKVTAIGNADAHGRTYRMGWLERVIFPYDFLFRAVNTHILMDSPFTGDPQADKEKVLSALRMGHAFVGCGLPAPARGFRFSGQGSKGAGLMGDTFPVRNGVTLQISAPRRATLRMVRNGQEIGLWENRESALHTAAQPGAYRAEAHLMYKNRLRGWIYSNPIYVRD